MIKGGNPNESEIWFKQDDQFDQPYVWAKLSLLCNDAGFPESKAIKAFITMWRKMLEEAIRELNYAAEEAGITFKSTWNGESIGFEFFSYNDGYH